jgi:cyclopropane fatty-acyl-phospholipid synthase-like methyltransferase
MSASPAAGADERYRLTRQLAEQWGQLVWDEFLGRFELPWEGSTVLDFGCGAGYTPMYLIERAGAAEAHGVDLHPVWEAMADGFRPQMLPGIRLHCGDVLELSELQRQRFDVIVSNETVSLLEPTYLMRVLHWFYDHLKPGGHCLIQTRTFAHHDGAGLGERGAPMAHLLFGEREIRAFLGRTASETTHYANPSCAATYLAQFARAGFVIERAERLRDGVDERLLLEHQAKLRWIDPEELRTSGLAVHLRRPVMPELSLADRRAQSR